MKSTVLYSSFNVKSLNGDRIIDTSFVSNLELSVAQFFESFNNKLNQVIFTVHEPLKDPNYLEN